MPGRIKIEKVTLSGFRAYLNEQTFSLLQGKTHKSLAIFAPNAKGKSSFVDAFEFFFSGDGTLARLGLRRSSMQAGKEALPLGDGRLILNADVYDIEYKNLQVATSLNCGFVITQNAGSARSKGVELDATARVRAC
jgi:hypothetical protein